MVIVKRGSMIELMIVVIIMNTVTVLIVIIICCLIIHLMMEVIIMKRMDVNWGAGIAQWLERRTRDRKVAGSNPCWSGGRIFFSRVNFLC